MAFPQSSRIELPILQELKATGGRERVKYLYQRLIPYFPQLADEDLKAKTKSGRSKWKSLVQKAGETLVEKGELKRVKGNWILTEKGRQRAEEEGMVLHPPTLQTPLKVPSHDEIKGKLVEIGRVLGKYAEAEHRYHSGGKYDVIWKDSETSPRISHVFEVQVKGKIESALTRLKHAYDTQRSKPFLVISDERDSRKASELLHPYFSGSFHEIGAVTTVLSLQDLERLYQALDSVRGILEKIFEQ